MQKLKNGGKKAIKLAAGKIKTIYFDFDGVLAISPPGGRAIYDALSKVLNLPLNTITESFKKCGYPFLSGEHSVDTFITNFSKALGKRMTRAQLDEAYLLVLINKPLLKSIRQLKKKYSVELVTNNTVYRFQVLKEKGIVDVWKEFDDTHISSDLGKFKSEFFFEVCNLQHGLFVDNNKTFLLKITKKGGNTLYYDSSKHDITDFENNLGKLLSK